MLNLDIVLFNTIILYIFTIKSRIINTYYIIYHSMIKKCICSVHCTKCVCIWIMYNNRPIKKKNCITFIKVILSFEIKCSKIWKYAFIKTIVLLILKYEQNIKMYITPFLPKSNGIQKYSL